MHLLYLDDSGSTKNPADRHVILAGLSMYERTPYWYSAKLDKIAEEVWPQSPYDIEFRGSDMHAGRKQWRSVARKDRENIYKRCLEIISTSKEPRLFGAVIHKAAISPEDPIEYAFEQLCSRFDHFLGRLHKRGDTQRGLIVLDKSSYETSLQGLALEFRVIGHRWGSLHNLAEVPLFVDSRATRMVQLADMVAYALRQYYERGNAEYFDIISGKFDSDGGINHGLIHRIPQAGTCACFVCRQKGRY